MAKGVDYSGRSDELKRLATKAPPAARGFLEAMANALPMVGGSRMVAESFAALLYSAGCSDAVCDRAKALVLGDA